jgi:hypothetical protein
LDAREPKWHKKEVKEIRQLVTDMGGKWYQITPSGKVSGGQTLSVGVPDLYCQIPRKHIKSSRDSQQSKGEESNGLSFWVEVKSALDTVKPEQEKFKEMEKACGGHVVIGGAADVRVFLLEKGFDVNEGPR